MLRVIYLKWIQNSLKMSEEKQYTLDELKKIYNNQDLNKICKTYCDVFKKSVDAYLNKNNESFDSYSKLVHDYSQLISSDINIKYAKICMFAHNLSDNKKILNGTLSEWSTDHLYFIASDMHIKIGRSLDVTRRLNTLQVDNPSTLSIKYISYNSGLYEKSVHRMFRYLRVKGEWFEKNTDIEQYIESLMRNIVEKADKYTPFKEIGTLNLLNDFK